MNGDFEGLRGLCQFSTVSTTALDVSVSARYREEKIRSKSRGQMLYRMSSHLLSGSPELLTALVDGMRKK
jgi:hypothetical protein